VGIQMLVLQFKMLQLLATILMLLLLIIYSSGNTSVSAIKGQVSFSTYSDERIKKDIKDTDLGLEFIKEL
jgi:hypothetical protein